MIGNIQLTDAGRICACGSLLAALLFGGACSRGPDPDAGGGPRDADAGKAALPVEQIEKEFEQQADQLQMEQEAE